MYGRGRQLIGFVEREVGASMCWVGMHAGTPCLHVRETGTVVCRGHGVETGWWGVHGIDVASLPCMHARFQASNPSQFAMHAGIRGYHTPTLACMHSGSRNACMHACIPVCP